MRAESIRRRAYLFARRYREGIDAIRAADALQPEIAMVHAVRANLYMSLGDTAAMLREARSAIRVSPDSPTMVGGMAVAFASAGRSDSARAILRAVEGLRAQPSYQIALAYERLGDRDRALRWLSTAVAMHDPW